MNQQEIEKEVIDMMALTFNLGENPDPTTPLVDLGVDSLDAVTLQIMLEDRFGEQYLNEYRPGPQVTAREIAAEIQKRLP
tara:strand:+ start:13945 stop:14184 length:240 start_codon:yes stop_codon:yes gene_type:complete